MGAPDVGRPAGTGPALLDRRSFLRGTAAGVLGGGLLTAGTRVAGASAAEIDRQYQGTLSGTLSYPGGGAEGDPDLPTTTVTHDVWMRVTDGVDASLPGANPIDFLIAPAVGGAILEGELVLTSGVPDVRAGSVVGYDPYWSLVYDPASGGLVGSTLAANGLNVVVVWWYGIHGELVHERVIPGSSIQGSMTADAVDLELSLWTAPAHRFEGTLSMRRTG